MKSRRSPSLVHLATLISFWVSLRLVAFGLFPASGPPLMKAGLRVAPPAFESPVFDPARVAKQVPDQALTKPSSPRLQQRAALRIAEMQATARPEMDRTASQIEAPVKVPRASNPGPADADVLALAGEGDHATADLRKWSLSAFALIRPGSGRAGIVPNGQLGGSQAGFRVQRALVHSGRFSVSANGRFSAPLSQHIGKEAGLGLAVRRSGRVPVELLAERRVGLDRGGRDAFAALIAGGFDDFRLPGRVLLSGYAQAGVVGLKRREGFVDGAIRAEHDLLTIGKTPIRGGAVVAGAKQPGVSRLDVGPSVAARFRLSRASFRLSAEWRERISGNAAPGSGPVITLGLDY
jgi:hypothetical protein